MPMEPEKDAWSWAAVLVSVVAIFAWAISVVTHIGGAWVPWVAGIVFVLAMGTVGVRSWRRVKDVVYTEEQVDALKLEYRRLFLTIILVMLLGLSMWIPQVLVQVGVLPQWAGAVLLVLLLVAVFVLRYAIRSSRMWKDLG
jgi:hypothetical protein